MKRKHNITILGDGRIGQAAAFYFRQSGAAVSFSRSERQLRRSDLLVGALPGELGGLGLALALKHRVALLDISDLDPEFYLDKRAEINGAGVPVIPGCGFCPGLVNFILGHEITALSGPIRDVEIKAGSLSRRKNFFPFLWCFEDLVQEHRLSSWQIIRGRKKYFPPFAGYQEERHLGIDAESYFSASGFENLLDQMKIRNLHCRVIRPRGFMPFFLFMDQMGLLSRERLPETKTVLEGAREDNLTLAVVRAAADNEQAQWTLHTCASKTARLNSMQMMTASVTAGIGQIILNGGLGKSGLVFMDELGQDPEVFKRLMIHIKKLGVTFRRQRSRLKP